MSDDPDKLAADLADLDWDQALDEWEKSTFVPEVARDAETNTVASPPDAGEQELPKPRPGGMGRAQSSLKNVSSEGTVIAPVPSELRDAPQVGGMPQSSPNQLIGARVSSAIPPPVQMKSAPPLAAPSPPARNVPPNVGSARGGLGQLFQKRDSIPPPVAPPRPAPPRPSEKTRVAPPVSTKEVPAVGSDRSPSVTRQVASPLQPVDDGHFGQIDSVRFDAEATAVATGSDLEETVARSSSELDDEVRRNAETAERPASRDDLPALGDDPRESENATVVADRQALGSMSDADTETRIPGEVAPRGASPADDEAPTFMRQSPSMAPSPIRPGSDPAIAAPSIPSTERDRPPAPEGPTEFEGEKPVSRWLDEATATAYRQRAAWLEEEARAIGDARDQARALLAVSELLALVGDVEGALAIATEARELAPELPLAWRQVRQLMAREPAALVEALDAEAARSPTPAARAHATLLAADVLRMNGDGDAAVQRWNSASRLDPADVRAHAARVAVALAQGNHSQAGTDLAENSELVALEKAVATALRMRGAPRPGTDLDLAMPVNDALRRVRIALGAQDVVGAAQAFSDLAGEEPALAKASLWISAALGSSHIAGRRAAARSLKTLATDGEPLARRQLAARGIELGDPELVMAALSDDAPLEAADRATLLALSGGELAGSLDWLDDSEPFAPLLDALSALSLPSDAEAAGKRARRTAGANEVRTLATLGRLLASKPESEPLDEALGAVPAPRSPAAAGVALEAAVRTRRWNELSDALSALPAGDDPQAGAMRHVAAALVAERAGNTSNAAKAWREAVAEGMTHDSGVRAIAALDKESDLSAELLRLADDMPDALPSAILRLEAATRKELGDDEQSSVLERVHRGAPTLGIGAFLAERIGRKRGDVDEVLRWIQERRSYANDPLEAALDSVREALLVADRDPELASTRLEEAHRSRPDDVALRELYERLSTEPPADRGAWREARAEKAEGAARALLYTEAALEHERAGDFPAALRAAKSAHDAGDAGLSRLVLDRAEIETGAIGKQVDDLIVLAKETDNDDVRRESHERIADLEAYGKKDRVAALKWHRAILERDPQHKPSLRFVEHTLIGEGRDDDLAQVLEQIAIALDHTGGGEVTAHAQLAARLWTRSEGGWERTKDMARLAASQPEPSLWALRALNAHARVGKDEKAVLETTTALLERTQRPAERAALLLRASEAAAREEQVTEARAFLEQAAQEDPGDVVTWGFLAEVRERSGETRAAAEACESLARTSAVPEHQLLAWYDAARIWLDEVKDEERGMSALESCAEIDPTHADVYPRLAALYSAARLDSELARLLEKRLATLDDEEEKVALQVELARTLGDMGELARAKESLESALAQRPDHSTALAALAELCAKEGDWNGAEQAYVRLARLLATPEEQRVIYEKLGEIYAVHTVNLSRAEVAYREVLKRAPNDMPTLEKLVDVYKRQGDTARAIETQQQIVTESTDPTVRLKRLIELSEIHETAGRDARRAEQVLESARKEFPTSVVALRAMAEFYARQRQMPAMQILLDRAAGDARRSFGAGRFVTALFEVLHAAYELRGRKDAARVVAATLAAVEGNSADLVGAEARAVDPRLDDVLAPEVISPALRALLGRVGDTLDAVSPLDLRSLRAQPLTPGTALGTTIGAVATVVGLGALQILVSPQLGRVALPLSSNPPTLLVGEGLMNVKNERARAFVVVRAMKMILSRSSALLRGQPADVAILVSALFTAFNPSFVPQGVDTKKVAEVSRRIVPALPRNLDPTIGVIALEAGGTLGAQTPQLGQMASAWANRVALLAIGDPSGALEAIAWARGEDAAPTEPEARAAWIARTPDARDLMAFSVTDGYAEARVRLGLDK